MQIKEQNARVKK